MKHYMVTFHQTLDQVLDVRVEADSQNEAAKKAEAFLNDPKNEGVEWKTDEGTEPDIISIEVVPPPLRLAIRRITNPGEHEDPFYMYHGTNGWGALTPNTLFYPSLELAKKGIEIAIDSLPAMNNKPTLCIIQDPDAKHGGICRCLETMAV